MQMELQTIAAQVEDEAKEVRIWRVGRRATKTLGGVLFSLIFLQLLVELEAYRHRNLV